MNITAPEQAMMNLTEDNVTRPYLRGVFFNCKHVVATTGTALVVRKKRSDCGIDNQVIKFNKKTMVKTSLSFFDEVGNNLISKSDSTNTGEKVDLSGYPYPDYERLLYAEKDNHSTNATEIRIDANLLQRLVLALGCSKKDAIITLSVRDSGAILVSRDSDEECIGLIMPCGSEKKSTSALDRLKQFLSVK